MGIYCIMVFGSFYSGCSPHFHKFRLFVLHRPKKKRFVDLSCNLVIAFGAGFTLEQPLDLRPDDTRCKFCHHQLSDYHPTKMQ